MPRNSGGTYSLPAGNPVVSGTVISSTWANTTFSDAATEITNSLDRSGRGGMLAPLQLTNGSSFAPALSFSSETNTGLYRASSADIRLQINGTTMQGWTASGISVSGTCSISGAVTLSAALSVGSTLAVTGAATLSSTLAVTGAATLGSTVAITGAATLSSNATVSGTLGVTGAATFAAGGIVTQSGTGHGWQATGGSSSGAIGLRGVGGANNGTGGAFYGGGSNGLGAFVQGVGAGAALEVSTGNVLFTAANPDYNTAYSNRLTPKNFAKIWTLVAWDGATATIEDGFNVSSVSVSDEGDIGGGVHAFSLHVNFATLTVWDKYSASVTAENDSSTASAYYYVRHRYQEKLIVGGLLSTQSAAWVHVSVFASQ